MLPRKELSAFCSSTRKELSAFCTVNGEKMRLITIDWTSPHVAKGLDVMAMVVQSLPCITMQGDQVNCSGLGPE